MQTLSDDVPAQVVRRTLNGSQDEAPEVEDDDAREKSVWQRIQQNPNLVSTLVLVIFLTLLSLYAAEAQGDKATYAMQNQIKSIYADFEQVETMSEWYGNVSPQDCCFFGPDNLLFL